MHSLTGERRASDLCGFARAEVLWATVGSRSTSGAIRRRMHRRPAARGQRVCNGALPRALRVVTAGHRRRAAGARRASILAASARVTRSGRALALCNVARCAPTARTANTRAACPGRFAAAAVGACYQYHFGADGTDGLWRWCFALRSVGPRRRVRRLSQSEATGMLRSRQ